MGLLDKIKKLNLFAGFSAIDDEFYDELEEALILSDMGMDTTLKAVEELRERVRGEKLKDRDEVRACLRRVLQDMLNVGDTGLALDTRPAVVLFIGVNGVGKTTTIGKLAAGLKAQGKKVLLCAGDTFRAAAADQLTVWADRAGVPIIKQYEGADPAAVVFDGVQTAKAKHADVLIVDTAGRLHNKAHLMEELKKMARVVEREYPEATTKALLVIDATTGQNGLAQAKVFSEVANLQGIVLTKLDGTAKGGIAIAIRNELGLPVRYIGLGEQIDDMQPFDAKEFVDAIFG